MIHLRRRQDRMTQMEHTLRSVDGTDLCFEGTCMFAHFIQHAARRGTVDPRIAGRFYSGPRCIYFDAFDAGSRQTRGVVGCRASHCAVHAAAEAVAQLAWEQTGTHMHAIIMEDDAVPFRCAPPALFEQTCRAVLGGALLAQNVDAVHLGPNAAIRVATDRAEEYTGLFASFVPLEQAMNAHAYLICSTFVRKMRERLWDDPVMEWALDESRGPFVIPRGTTVEFDIAWFACMSPHTWLGVPVPVFMQAEGYSDIEEKEKRSQHRLSKRAMDRLKK